MTDRKDASGEEMVTCEVCLKEIPASLAVTGEAADYVHYFCGADCYAKWQEQEGPEE